MGKEIITQGGGGGVGEALGKSLALSNNARDMPLLSLNHVSFVCKSVRKSVEFYERVLGFVLIQRPSSFDFEGAWLFNHGIGIHLLQSEKAEKEGKVRMMINPKDNHISFECTDMEALIRRLEMTGVEYVKAVVREGGIIVDQLFFHDPDGYMIEICNCHNLPLLPLSSSLTCPLTKAMHPNNVGKMQCSGEVEALMMENLATDMLNLSI